MSNFLGQQLGNYRLIRLIGHGGFADVYLGEHVRLGMQAAIKVLHSHLSRLDISAFEREAQMIAELDHPNIVRVLDFDTQYDRPFLVLNYAPNGSLGQRHPRGTQISLSQAQSYLEQVTSALQYAHDRKVVHRDIKPENMLIGKKGEILLTDFGIAGTAHTTASLNGQHPVGTLDYMAPEQIQGHSRPASDQYALAVSVYQWLGGMPPFQGSSSEVVAQHLGATVPPLRTRIPGIPVEVDRVILKALAKNPHERYARVLDFFTAFSAAASKRGETSPNLTSVTAPFKHNTGSSTQTNSASRSAANPASITDRQKSHSTPLSLSGIQYTGPVSSEKITARSQGQSGSPIGLEGFDSNQFASRPRPFLKKRMTILIAAMLVILIGASTFAGINLYRVWSFENDYQTITSRQPDMQYSMLESDTLSRDTWIQQSNRDCGFSTQGYATKNASSCSGSNGLMDQATSNLLVEVTVNVLGSCGILAVSVAFHETEICTDGTVQNCQSADCQVINTSEVVAGQNQENRLALEVLDSGDNQITLVTFVNGHYVSDRVISADKALAKPNIFLKSRNNSDNVLFKKLQIWEVPHR